MRALRQLKDGRHFPRWVPLPPAVEHHTLSRLHPFWRDADRALFLARRDGRVVGRVAAVENRAHNRRHDDRTGFFGFFDALDEPDVAPALLAAARAWLGARGLRRIRGPVSPSMNYEVGCLVEGADEPNAFYTAWSPPWYGPALESAGLEPVQDLTGVWIPADHRLPERVERAADVARRRSGITFREIDPSEPADIERVRALYVEAWSDTWGFVPPDRVEFSGLASLGRYMMAEGLGFFALADGEEEPAAFAIVTPDYNRVLAGAPWHRWAPVAALRIVRGRSRIPAGRILLLGLRDRYRGSRLLPLLIQEILRRGDPERHEGAEASWLVEGGLMERALLGIGLDVTRRWRLYEGPVPSEDVSPSTGARDP